MPIDPQAQMILDAMADADFQLTPDVSPEQMREGMKAGPYCGSLLQWGG